jgi:N-sulfoglucosamine sulfohydrolase
MSHFNIVYLHSHDTGRYIQPYGYGIATPNLQKLAEEGVLFRQAFCASPTCSPSRAALLTGAFPHANGMLGLAHFGFGLNDYSQHILHTLRAAGYTSILAGEQHIAKDPTKIGFDQVLDDPIPADERAVQFLAHAPAQPFFLDIGFNETHRVYPEPGPGENPNYLRPPAPLPDTPETRRDMAGYARSARILDQKMGRVLAALAENGLAETTLVICTTDHGLAFPAMKCNLTDHGTGIMLILRCPDLFKGGRAIDALASQVDIFPTLCDLLGIQAPAWLQGKSLAPLLRGEKENVRDAVFSEINFHVSYEPQRAVRTTRWKYIRRFDKRTRPVMPNCDDSPSKDLWMSNGWRERAVAQEQLYDLMFDPNEACNIADDSAYISILTEMRTQMYTWMQETDDPLLRGPLQWPEGFPRLDPDQTSPSEIVW